ncbi:MAG: hypothetical protein IJ874_01095 [Ruminococcus sp.]|nr:hypothetical protein [Ruminococcus sp.]
MFLITDLLAILAANLILTQALGTSTLFVAAKSRRGLLWTAVNIMLLTTGGSAAAYSIDILLPESAADFRLLLYIAAVGLLYILLLLLLYIISRKSFGERKKYVHLSAFNCAVMGTLLTISGRASGAPELMTLKGYVLAGAEAGFGFILAALILTAAYGRLSSEDTPASFRGFPAMLVYLGLISMAVYTLS